MNDALLGFGLAFTLQDNFSQAARNIKNEFAGLAKDATGFQSKMDSAMKGMTSGFSMMAAGATMLAPLGYAVNEAANFQAQLKELSAITGVTGADLDDIGERAMQLTLKFGGDPLKSVDSFKTILSRLGPDIAKSPLALQAMGDSVETLAKTMRGDTLGAVNALTTGILQYGIDLSNPIEASKAMISQMNVMAASAQVGSAEVPQIAASLKVAGLEAKSSGLSFEEFNATIQIMGKGTVYGAEAGTALRNVLGKLGESRFIPKDTATELRKAGVDVNLLADTTKPLAERLKELGKIQADTALVGKFFGVENKNAAMLLMQNIPDLEKWTAQVKGTNSATDQAAVIMGDFNEQMKRGEAAMKVAGISIGNVLLPYAAKLLNVTNGLVEGFANFAKTDIGKGFVGLAGAVGVSLVGFGSFVVGFNAVKMAMTMAQPAVTWLKTSILGLNAALLPYIGIAAAVGVAVYGLVKAYQSFDDLVNGKAEVATGFMGFLQKVGGLLHFVREGFSSATSTSIEFSAQTQEGLNKLGLEGIAYNLGAWIINIKGFFSGVGKGFDKLKQSFSPLFNSFTMLGNSITNLLSRFDTDFGKSKSQFSAFSLAGKLAFEFVMFPITALNFAITTVTSTLSFLIDVGLAFYDNFSGVFGDMGLLFDEFMNGGLSFEQMLTGIFYNIGGRMTEMFENLLNSWTDFKLNIIQSIASLPFGQEILGTVGVNMQQKTTQIETPTPVPYTNEYVANEKANQVYNLTNISSAVNNVAPALSAANASSPIVINATMQVGSEDLAVAVTQEQQFQEKRKN